MDNSMDININQSVNSMNTLDFYWAAYFKDGTEIYQFQDNKEQRFQEVLNKFDELIYFKLHHKNKNIIFGVDLIKGLINYNLSSDIHTDLLQEEKYNIRLIYFRRNRKDFTLTGQLLNYSILYILGYQYNDKTGNNHKLFLQIDKDGNFVIGN